MPPARVDPYHDFNFQVEIDGIPQSGFREVIMPAATADVIEYREGHEPSVVRKLKGRVHFGNLILRWGSGGISVTPGLSGIRCPRSTPWDTRSSSRPWRSRTRAWNWPKPDGATSTRPTAPVRRSDYCGSMATEAVMFQRNRGS